MVDPVKQHSGVFLSVWGAAVSQWQWLAAHWPTLNEWVLITTTIAGIMSFFVSLQKFRNDRQQFKINEKKVKK